ncbi:MAG: PstS family phosphate ABC transporter substrate-binding protein [Acidobacteriota bacterium]
MNRVLPAMVMSAVLLLSRCAGNPGPSTGPSETIHIDGSSTGFPVTEAVAEEFRNVRQAVRVTVGISGTGGGFKKFCAGEIDINDASRPIKASEIRKARENGMEFIELPVGIDGLSVVVNPANDFVDYLTVEELRKIWSPGSTVHRWSDIRPGWPDRPITLYGPDTDSGTFDYFTEAINGKAQVCRPDYTASADDNVLVHGVAGDENALGFFGYAYFEENRSKLKLVPVDAGDGPIAPAPATISDGSYAPLSRPIFIYVNKESLERPEVEAFVSFYLEEAPQLVREVGYVPLPANFYALSRERHVKRIAGTGFSLRTGSTIGSEDLVDGGH